MRILEWREVRMPRAFIALLLWVTSSISPQVLRFESEVLVAVVSELPALEQPCLQLSRTVDYNSTITHMGCSCFTLLAGWLF
jgi:hypothetical protein